MISGMWARREGVCGMGNVVYAMCYVLYMLCGMGNVVCAIYVMWYG